jgi:hypothetical protein
LIFLGQEKFARMKDTLVFFNTNVDTEDIKRKRMLQFLKLGLTTYIARSPQAENLEISFGDMTSDKSDTLKAKDKYNLWQFSIGTSGFFNGNRNNSSRSLGSFLSASRETEKESVSIDFGNNLDREKFTLFYRENGIDTSRTIIATRDQQYLFSYYRRKLNEHWGLAINLQGSRSIVDNLDLSANLNPAIEYSVLPYKDFNTSRIVLKYNIGPQYLDYADSTIYLKVKELLVQQGIGATASFTKPWGTLSFGVQFENYLSDFDKNNLFIGGGFSWNVTKGLRFGIGGNFQFIHDQISIPKGDVSIEDLLTERRLIGTTYSYFFGTGISYTFGSIYNSQVNPTFKGLSYNLSF